MATLNDRLIDKQCRELLEKEPDKDPIDILSKKLGCSRQYIIQAVQRVGKEKRK